MNRVAPRVNTQKQIFSCSAPRPQRRGLTFHGSRPQVVVGVCHARGWNRSNRRAPPRRRHGMPRARVESLMHLAAFRAAEAGADAPAGRRRAATILGERVAGSVVYLSASCFRVARCLPTVRSMMAPERGEARAKVGSLAREADAPAWRRARDESLPAYCPRGGPCQSMGSQP